MVGTHVGPTLGPIFTPFLTSHLLPICELDPFPIGFLERATPTIGLKHDKIAPSTNGFWAL